MGSNLEGPSQGRGSGQGWGNELGGSSFLPRPPLTPSHPHLTPPHVNKGASAVRGATPNPRVCATHQQEVLQTFPCTVDASLTPKLSLEVLARDTALGAALDGRHVQVLRVCTHWLLPLTVSPQTSTPKWAGSPAHSTSEGC